MPGYDSWKARNPDEGLESPDEPTAEQQRADYEDSQQMTKEQIDAIPRKEARQLLAQIPAGQGYDDRVLLAVEQAMNLEWWRGFYAGKMSDSIGR